MLPFHFMDLDDEVAQVEPGAPSKSLQQSIYPELPRVWSYSGLPYSTAFQFSTAHG